MRFPRNAKIFRGQIDAAPVAGVFFLLVIFMLLFSLVYTPGIPIQLSQSASAADNRIKITESGDIVFREKIYKTNSLDELRAVLKSLPQQTTLIVEGDSNAHRDLLAELRGIAKISDLRLQVSGAGIDLPKAQILATATGPTVVVAVNLAGQFFYENQIIDREKLKTRLAEEAQNSRAPLTLVVLADKAVEYDVIVGLTQLAEQAGIHQALLQVSPITAKNPR